MFTEDEIEDQIKSKILKTTDNILIILFPKIILWK